MLNAWLRRSWVWCLVTGCQLSSGRTQPSVWRRFSRPIRCLGRGAIRRKHRAVSACSVFWFLAPWVALVQSIGSRHSALGAAINCRAAPASNQSQQFVAYGHRTPLSGRRCASALCFFGCSRGFNCHAENYVHIFVSHTVKWLRIFFALLRA